MFTQRHYEFLARLLKQEIEVAEAQTEEREKTLQGFARILASELERDNPRFDRAKFLKAAGNIPDWKTAQQ